MPIAAQLPTPGRFGNTLRVPEDDHTAPDRPVLKCTCPAITPFSFTSNALPELPRNGRSWPVQPPTPLGSQRAGWPLTSPTTMAAPLIAATWPTQNPPGTPMSTIPVFGVQT